MSITRDKPLIVTFRDLRAAMAPLHMHEKAWVDALHDVWLTGGPTPDSIIRNPKGYDPRKRQPGNVEKRIVSPLPVAIWMQQVSAARGMALTSRQALNILAGDADYGLEAHE